jgi:hypothetical protein
MTFQRDVPYDRMHASTHLDHPKAKTITIVLYMDVGRFGF